MGSEYDDAYPTCARTHATLRVYSGSLAPAIVTERLGIEPSETQVPGEDQRFDGGPPIKITLNGWFLSTRGLLHSKDARRHIDWLLARIAQKREAIGSLIAEGCRIDISCYWLSASGHGGPTLSPAQMGGLAELDLELWFDVYLIY